MAMAVKRQEWTGRDVALAAILGTGFSLACAWLLMTAVLTWWVGGDLAAPIYDAPWVYSPLAIGYWTRGYELALMAGGGVVALGAVVPPLVVIFGGKDQSHGSARWQTASDLCRSGMRYANPLEAPGPIIAKLGRPHSRAAYLALNAEQPHMVVAGPTGSGKGVSVINPTLLTWQGSSITLDIKGELFEATARTRHNMGHNVYRFAPGDADGRSHRINPLDSLRAFEGQDRYEAAFTIASSLLVSVNKGQEGFIEGARSIFAATALHVLEAGTPNITAIHDLLTGSDAKSVFTRLAMQSQNPSAKSTFTLMAAQESRILSSYMSVLFETGLRIWSFASVRSVTEESDFAFDTFRARKSSLYLVVPAAKLHTYAPLMRLIFRMSIDALQARLPEPDEPHQVLFVFDEFSSLGAMGQVPQVMTSIRGFGGRFLIAVTQISDLIDVYGEAGKDRILGNADVQVFTSANDALTPRHVSDAIGDETSLRKTRSWSLGDVFKDNYSESAAGRPLLRAEEMRRLPRDSLIVLVTGQQPILARKIRYFEDRRLQSVFEAQNDQDWPGVPKLDVADDTLVVSGDNEAASTENGPSQLKTVLSAKDQIDMNELEKIHDRVNAIRERMSVLTASNGSGDQPTPPGKVADRVRRMMRPVSS